MEVLSGVAIILYIKEGRKILMQHRSADAPRFPNYWSCFGGGIEAGETPEEAIRREMIEEIEYTLQSPRLIDRDIYPEKDRQIISHTFIEEYDPSQPIVLHEGQGYGWFTIAEALTLHITNRRRESLQRFEPLIFGVQAISTLQSPAA
jgi:8-oxo-dGTP diphosphatase